MIVGETKRLTLRNWTQDDATEFASLFTDPRISRFLGNGFATKLDVIDELARRIMESEHRGWGSWAVVQRDTQQIIGSCGFGNHTLPIPSIGWRVIPEFWNQGFATEAARCVLAIGFTDHKFDRVDATCHSSNRASIRVMQKLGMYPVEMSDVREIVRYSVLRDERS